MIKHFSDMKSLNIVFMFKYMFCNTQNLILADQCEIVTDLRCVYKDYQCIHSIFGWLTWKKNHINLDW